MTRSFAIKTAVFQALDGKWYSCCEFEGERRYSLAFPTQAEAQRHSEHGVETMRAACTAFGCEVYVLPLEPAETS